MSFGVFSFGEDGFGGIGAGEWHFVPPKGFSWTATNIDTWAGRAYPPSITVKGFSWTAVVDGGLVVTYPAFTLVKGFSWKAMVSPGAGKSYPAVITVQGFEWKPMVTGSKVKTWPSEIVGKGFNWNAVVDAAKVYTQPVEIVVPGFAWKAVVDKTLVRTVSPNALSPVIVKGFSWKAVVPPKVLVKGFSWRAITDKPVPTGMDVAYCYHLNNENRVTRFTHFPFLRIVRTQGKTYGYTRTGKYLIGGGNDNGTAIAASFELAPSNFGLMELKRCPWLHYAGSGEVRIEVIVGGTGGKKAGPFKGREYRNQQGRAQMAGGLVGGLWAFKFISVPGKPFKISWVNPDFQVLNKKV